MQYEWMPVHRKQFRVRQATGAGEAWARLCRRRLQGTWARTLPCRSNMAVAIFVCMPVCFSVVVLARLWRHLGAHPSLLPHARPLPAYPHTPLFHSAVTPSRFPPPPQYLELVKELITSGTFRPDRTGTGTYSRLGRVTRWNLRHTFPLLTSKRVFWKGEGPAGRGGGGAAVRCGVCGAVAGPAGLWGSDRHRQERG